MSSLKDLLWRIADLGPAVLQAGADTATRGEELQLLEKVLPEELCLRWQQQGRMIRRGCICRKTEGGIVQILDMVFMINGDHPPLYVIVSYDCKSGKVVTTAGGRVVAVDTVEGLRQLITQLVEGRR